MCANEVICDGKKNTFLRLSKLNKKAFAFRVLLYVRNFRVTKSARGYVHQTVCSRKIKHTSLFFLTFQEHSLINYHGNMMTQMLYSVVIYRSFVFRYFNQDIR